MEIKGEREKTKNDITTKERDGEMSEDERRLALEELQGIVDETNGLLETVGDKKEKEILGE